MLMHPCQRNSWAYVSVSSVQLLSCLGLFEIPWTTAHQASLFITNIPLASSCYTSIWITSPPICDICSLYNFYTLNKVQLTLSIFLSIPYNNNFFHYFCQATSRQFLSIKKLQAVLNNIKSQTKLYLKLHKVNNSSRYLMDKYWIHFQNSQHCSLITSCPWQK